MQDERHASELSQSSFPNMGRIVNYRLAESRPHAVCNCSTRQHQPYNEDRHHLVPPPSGATSYVDGVVIDDGLGPAHVSESSFTNGIVPKAWNDGQVNLVFDSSLLNISSWDGHLIPAGSNLGLSGFRETLPSHPPPQFQDDGFDFIGRSECSPLSSVSYASGTANQVSNGGYTGFLSVDEQDIFGPELLDMRNDYSSFGPSFDLNNFQVSDQFLVDRNQGFGHMMSDNTVPTTGWMAATSFLNPTTVGPFQQGTLPSSMAQDSFNLQYNNTFIPRSSHPNGFGESGSMAAIQVQLPTSINSQNQLSAAANIRPRHGPNGRSRTHLASARRQHHQMTPLSTTRCT
ncbi:uncharacterized protein PAC_19914 [Phialocephala subalpina]|uniref:Uncharacterized protein n=1 Tax=Phialocephala subalpina TaxID=576137 RepID=A0A1L7XY63_9HELO|nr:uncharacterized protein PAC_19914 [Phialocephala subalpina]